MNRAFRVLLVEDNEADAELTTETLESSQMHVEVAVATDGAEAVAYLQQKPPFVEAEMPDVVLLDLNLPKLDGRQVLAEVRRNASSSHVPVVILSSSDAEHDIQQTYALGANCYVTKPVGLGAYRAAIRSVGAFWFEVAKLP